MCIRPPLNALQDVKTCPAFVMDRAAAEAGRGRLRLLYQLGGSPQEVLLPYEPLSLQPLQQQRDGSSNDASFQACVPAWVLTQLVRLSEGLFPLLQDLHWDLERHPAVQFVADADTLDDQQRKQIGGEAIFATPIQQVQRQRCQSNSEA
jgi:hypothetical protein